MLPASLSLDTYRELRRDTATQLTAMRAIAARHGLAESLLEPFSRGTHLVWRAGDAVIKLFAPLWPRDAEVERTVLDVASGTGVVVPDLRASGEIDGWPYVVMSRVPGRPIGVVWPQAGPGLRVRLARQMGEVMARFHALPTAAFEPWRTDLTDLVSERLPRLRSDQRERGGGDALDETLAAFLRDLDPPPAVPSVPLHADLTDDHLLVDDTGRITGLIDFADAFLGPWTYEFAAPACFMTRGLPECERALLDGYGVASASNLREQLRVWCVLHRYAHIAYMMRDAGASSFDAWYDAFWRDIDGARA